MLNICPPRKDSCLLWIHSKCNSLIPRDVCIAYKERTPFQRVTRHPLHPRAFVRVHDKVITPGHCQYRTESTQGSDECAILNRTRVDQIRLNLLRQTSKVEGQTWNVSPTEFALSACPQDLLDILRNRSIFGLALALFQSQKEYLMLCLGKRREKPIIVRSVVL